MQNFYDEVEKMADEALKAIYREDYDKAKDFMYSLIIAVKLLKKSHVSKNKVAQRTYNSLGDTTRHNMHVVG